MSPEKPQNEPAWFQVPRVDEHGNLNLRFESKSESDYQDPPEYVEKVAACKAVVDRMTAYGANPDTQDIYATWAQKRDRLIADLAEALGSRESLEESRTYHILTHSTPGKGTIKVFDAAGSDEILDFIMNYENRNGLDTSAASEQRPVDQV